MIPLSVRMSVAEESFRYHPERESIIARLIEGDFTTTDVDRWFAEESAACARRLGFA